MFGLKKHLKRLDAENAELREEISKLRSMWDTVIDTSLTQHIADVFNASKHQIRSEISEMAKEEVNQMPCKHHVADSVVIGVEVSSTNVPDFELADLLGVDKSGKVTRKTCYASHKRGDNDNTIVFARICEICGRITPVNWFEVAAAGEKLTHYKMVDFSAIQAHKPIVKPAATTHVSALDSMVDF